MEEDNQHMQEKHILAFAPANNIRIRKAGAKGFGLVIAWLASVFGRGIGFITVNLRSPFTALWIMVLTTALPISLYPVSRDRAG